MDSRSLRSRRAAIAVSIPLVLACAVSDENVDLSEPMAPPAYFVREPYLIGVTDSSAVVRWTSTDEIRPGIRFWVDADTTGLVLSESGRDHQFVMRGLAPDTEYTYQIQFADTVWSEAASFRTFGERGSREPFTFLVLGDSGTLSSGQLRVARQLNEESALLMLHVGDIAYPDGMESDYTDKFFRIYAPLLKRVPFYPTPGDHDLRTAEGEPYFTAFTPVTGRGSGDRMNYAFDVNNVRFLSVYSEDSEHIGRFPWFADADSDPGRWFRSALAEARDDPRIDWTIVFMHHPPYSASTGFSGHGSHSPTRRALVPLADEYGIDIVFSGHDHDYQRSRPLRGNEVVDEGEGTVYIVTGGGGARQAFRGTGSDWYTAFGEKAYQYTRASVDGYSLTIEAVDDEGAVIDEYEITIPEEQRKREPVEVDVGG